MSLFNQGQAAFQPESLTPARIGFSPVSVRFANLAPQDATTWNSAAGTATITTGITAPDSTTYAATLACPTNDRAYRRIYSTECTVCIGDWLMCGVYVKAGMLTQGANQPTSTMANFAAATLRILDDTEGYQIDIDGLNYRNLTASEDADTTWQWITTAAKIELAPSGDSATVALDLNCDPDHAVSFYAPTLWHIPANTLTDAEVQAQLLNFYPVPDAAEAGIVATLAGQSFQSKLRDAGGQVFNVRASGAIGDGVTDDTLAIQSVLDKAATTVGKTYRTVFVPAGNWKVSGLILTGNVRLIGAGDGETLLFSMDNAPIINCRSSDFEMPVVEKLRIRGSVDAGSNQIGLKVDDPLYGLRAAVRDVWIENCGGDGLYVGLAFSSIFENIFATNCAGYPFHYNAPNMPGNVFLSCYAGNVRDTAPVGFRIRAGEAILKGCNGINSLNPGSKWAVVGKKSGVDGDTAHAGAVLDLEDCNLESYIDSGILAYSFSFINLRGNTTFVGQALSTTLNGGINNSVTTLTVASTQYFSNAGTIEIDSERITYTGKTSTTFTGCTRGVHGTSAASHSNGATVKFLKKPIEWEHINEGTDYFAHTLARGIIEDSVRFTDGPLTNYVRNEAIHCNGFPPFQTVGRGARVVSGDPLSSYWNSTTGASAKLSRADSYLSKLTITGTTSITQPGVQYVEVNHSGATTLTLPWPALYTLGDLIIVKDVSSAGAATNNILLNANGGGTVNGSSYTLNVNGQAVVLAPDGSNDWRIVSTYSPGGNVTGTGASGRLAYWSGTSTLTSDTDATFDGFNATFGRVYHSGGTGGAPGLSSSSDTGSGFYLSSTGVYGYASSAANSGAGGNVLLLKGDRVTLNGNRISWDTSETIHDLVGSGSPEGVVTASVSSLYRRSNGGTGTTLYIKESGTGNTGWVGINGSNPVQAINARADYGAVGDGVTSDTTAIASALAAANTQGRPLYFPTGTYLLGQLDLNDLNSVRIFGDGPGRSTLKSSDSTKAVLDIDAASTASHSITIEELSIEGAGTGSNNHGIHVHGSGGLFNITLRNVHARNCGGRGVYITSDAFTQLLEGVDVSDCGDHAIDVVSGNTTTLSRCYVHNVATNKAAYRLRYGDYTLIGCNGIDSGTTADWGVFGQNTGDDGVETYTRATLIGCNLEDFTNRGIHFKTGSFANFFSTAILAPASGTVKALQYEFVGTNATGIFDAASSIGTKGASWSSGYAVHSSGAPFLQLGHADTTSYYDTNVGGATTLPALTANLIAGSANYAHTLSRAKITALEASTLVGDLTGNTSFTGDAARVLLQAGSNSRPTLASTDTNTTGIYFPSSGANLAATVSGTQRLLLGTNHTLTGNLGINTAGSSSYALEVASGAARFTGVNGASDPVLELRAATNPHLLISDTANTIMARFGTLAGAPDRALVGTITNHPLGFYQNGSERWTLNTSGHLVPGSATTYNIGSASLPINDIVIGGSAVFAERTAPSTPSANTVALYAKDKSGVSTLYYKKDDGTEVEIGSGGGGSGDVVGPSSAIDNALARFDTTTGKLIQNSGLALSDLSTSTYTLAVTAPSAASTSTAGYSLIGRASNAVAGTSTNGAAAGGDWSAIAGDAARLNTGDANGGNIYLIPGAKIGGGADGQVILGRVGTTSVPALTWAGNLSSGISLINSGIQFSLSGTNNAAVDANGFKASSSGRLDFSSDNTTSGTTDLALSRFAANTLRIGGDTAGSTAGKLFVSRSDKTHTGWFTLCGDSSNTNAVDNVGAIGLDSTSTTATGFGSQLLLTLESTSTNQRQAAGLTWLWTTATDASRSADLYFSTVNAGTVAEAFRVVGSGAFRSAAISDPASPTNGDIWNSSARNCYSVRQSGQTEDFSTSIWRSSAISSFDTTTTATSIIADTGVGTKTIAANRLKVGNHIRITAGGLYGTKATSAGTLTVRVTNGGTTMLTAVFTLPDGVFDLVWSLEAEGAVSATGTIGTIHWRLLWLMSDASGVAYAMSYTTNSTTINTTTNRAMDVTGQFSVSSADNYFQTDNASIEILA